MATHLPSLNALRAFEAAGRHLSFSKAAEELHVTPAAVGHQVKALEQDLGTVLFDHVVLVYLVFALVPLAAWCLYRTPWGLALRTVGENPHAAASAGVSVAWMRYQALMISGALSE